jgi:hypothetical protein
MIESPAVKIAEDTLDRYGEHDLRLVFRFLAWTVGPGTAPC